MKVLFYSPYSLDSNGMAGLMDEAAEYLQDENNEVLFVTCSGEIKPCDINAEQSRIRCVECMFSSRLLIGQIQHPKFKHEKLSHYLSDATRRAVQSINYSYDSIEEAKNIRYKEMNTGLGVVSSYVSMTRNLNPAFNKTTRDYFDQALRVSALLTEATLAMVDEFQPDLICIVNGRYGTIRPVLEVSQKLKIKINIIEFTFSSDRLKPKKVRFVDTLPHDIDKNSKVIEDNWDAWSGSRNKEEVAEAFFQKRKKGETASDTVYIGNQDHNRLPENWDPLKRNYVIFNSSEDEFFCVGDSFDKYKLFNSQIEGTLYLLQKAASDPSIHFYLRVHPNLQGIKFSYHTGLAALFKDYANITVIPSDSPVSTYKLIDNCEKVFVFGSTAGVEAVYWGKPVVLLGGSFYIHLNVAYYPQHLEELDALLFETLEPKPKLGALKYALYVFGERGVPFRYINYDYAEIRLGKKKLSLPRCYQYKGSMVPYLIVVAFFRLLNIASHLMFKKFTMDKLSVEK